MTSKLTVKIGADIEELKKELHNATNSLNTFNKGMSVIGTAIAGAFTIDALVGFGKEVFNVTAKFQKFEAVLTNTLGSNSKAKRALDQITDFAAKTPFQVDELTESFVKLVNQGFTPTVKEMTSLGDLAASQGKSFNQLTEAIIDAQTGEFERLKEFGIRASKEGDKVTFTFKGVKQQVDFTAESIREYVLSLGEAKGVSGGMEAISKTLGGQFSNLQDAVDQLQLALGNAAEQGGAVSITLDAITRSVQLLTKATKDEGVNKFFTEWFKLVTSIPRGLLRFIESVAERLEKLSTQNTQEELRKLRDELALAEIDYRAWQETGMGDGNKIKQKIADITSEIFKLQNAPKVNDPIPWVNEAKSQKLEKYTTALERYLKTANKTDSVAAPSLTGKESTGFSVGSLGVKVNDQLKKALSEIDTSLINSKQSFESWLSTVRASLEQAAQGMLNIGPIIANAVTGIAEAIGNAMAGNGDFGKDLLKAVAGFAKQLGALFIATGIAEAAFQSGNPYAMIAAGVALVALGTAISGMMDKQRGGSRAMANAGGGGGAGASGFNADGSMQDSAPKLVTVVKGQDLWVLLENYQRGNIHTRAV